MPPQPFEFGGEHQRVCGPAEVQWLYSEAVANQMEDACCPIPQRKCEHADEPVQCRFDPPFFERAKNNLGVAATGKSMTALFEFAAQLAIVIDLSVICDYEASARRDHRLMTGGRKIENGQPAMSQCEAGFAVGPDTAVVGSAMREAGGHGRSYRVQSVRAERAVPDSCDSAHS